jgi:hypothetical protein
VIWWWENGPCFLRSGLDAAEWRHEPCLHAVHASSSTLFSLHLLLRSLDLADLTSLSSFCPKPIMDPTVPHTCVQKPLIVTNHPDWAFGEWSFPALVSKLQDNIQRQHNLRLDTVKNTCIVPYSVYMYAKEIDNFPTKAFNTAFPVPDLCPGDLLVSKNMWIYLYSGEQWQRAPSTATFHPFTKASHYLLFHEALGWKASYRKPEFESKNVAPAIFFENVSVSGYASSYVSWASNHLRCYSLRHNARLYL